MIEALNRLLTATSGRPAQLGCFGLHEWAMVYRLAPGEQRHEQLPLRLSQEETDAVVEGSRVRCSHFDAYRFFTADAVGRNSLRPTREDQVAFEQPGCLHAGMDLYKHAFRLSPMIPSELLADCFELAHDIRVLDMRASPYDLSDVGIAPVAIETPAGKAEYVERQRGFTAREAVDIGLINKCVPQKDLLAETLKWCETMKGHSALTIRMTKRSLNFESDNLYSSWQHGMELLANIWGTEESLEGMQAFLDHRKPDFNKFRRRNKEAAQLLMELMTTSQIRDSKRLATSVLAELGDIGNVHKPHVEQAGFAVLKAPDIPSVLVETAFISNPEEEAKLRSAEYQQQLADAVGVSRQSVNSIERQRYEPSLSLALRFARVFGCATDDIFTLESDR